MTTQPNPELYGNRHPVCPECKRQERDGRCRNRKCPRFLAADPAVVRESLELMRKAAGESRFIRRSIR